MQTKMMKQLVLTQQSANPIKTEVCKTVIDLFRFLLFRVLFRVIVGAACGFIAFVALSYLVACPPMHWFYEVGEDAGPASIYLPGGGFSGFWFHLGYLYSFSEKNDLHDYDFYCFSAGCLSILPVFLNHSLEHVYDAALASQNAWKRGHRSRFEIVDYFLEELLPPVPERDCAENKTRTHWAQNEQSSCADDLDFLPRIKILVTTPWDDDGYAVLEPKSRSELIEYIKKTTWVPYLTGEGIRMTEHDESNQQRVYLDGGFSRTLHPKCDAEWHLPIMWETLVHTFSPGLTRDQVQSLWEGGKNYEYPVPARFRNTTANMANHSKMQTHRSPVASPNRWGFNNTFETSSATTTFN